ncbi:MAG: exosortase H-associated membrane protein, partial [Luminiphilus sp.]
FVLTVTLMPITFGIWYAAGTLFAAPAVWLCDFLLSSAYPNIVEAVGLQGAEVLVRTQFGEDGGVVMAAADAGNQIALEINTRLVSYSIAFYAALLMASNLKDAIYKFCIGLFWLWLIMAFGLASILGKDLLLMVGAPFLNAPGVPPADLIALTYQFNVLLMPTLAPVCLWFWQLRGSPLWEALAADIKRASARA